MSRIDDLLAELAPSGVTHRQLGEVVEYSPSRVDAAILDSTTFVGVDSLLPNKAGRVPAAYSPNTDRLTSYKPGDILIGNIRPYLKKIWLADNSGGCSGDVLCLRIKSSFGGRVEPDFLFYLLSSDRFFHFDMKHAKGAKMPRGDKAAILTFGIPLPPLEVQREIVRVLDQFTRLEAELEAELEARRSQRLELRERLFMDAVRRGADMRPLGELGSIMRGKRFTKADYVSENGVPVIHYGEIYTDYGTAASETVSQVRSDLSVKLRFASPGDVIVTDVGETVADVGKPVAWVGDEPVAIHDHCYALRTKLDPVFLAHYMQTRAFGREKNKHVARTKVKTLLPRGLEQILVPVPPASEQLFIARSLDQVEALTSDLTIGLPAEIAARRKQYEYYRDKLLTFEEAS